MAKAIALGDADPVTLLPMEDINPRFVPRSLKPLPLSSNLSSLNQKDKGKGKAPTKSASEGILSFFGSFTKMRRTS
jgi:exonuclease-1